MDILKSTTSESDHPSINPRQASESDQPHTSNSGKRSSVLMDLPRTHASPTAIPGTNAGCERPTLANPPPEGTHPSVGPPHLTLGWFVRPNARFGMPALEGVPRMPTL